MSCSARKSPYRLLTLSVILALSLSACGLEELIRQAKDDSRQGRYEESLGLVRQGLQDNPTDPQLRTAYLVLREKAVQEMLERGEAAAKNNDEEAAKGFFLRVLRFDGDNARAKVALKELERTKRHKLIIDGLKTGAPQDAAYSDKLRALLSEDGEHADALALQRKVDAEAEKSGVSKIDKVLAKQLSIQLKEVALKQVFEAFSALVPVNFVLDKDVRSDQKVVLNLNDTTLRSALDVVLIANQLEYRSLDDNTILIFPNTPAKLKDYQLLTVRGFFLSNADPESVAAALKGLLKLKDIIVDKRQNQVIVRDTIEAVKTAEKLIALYDLPEPEVMLEVEILEISRTKLTALGVHYPDSISLSPISSTSGTPITLKSLRDQGAESIGVTLSPLAINAKGQASNANLLANPRIRVRNRDTAKILIGDKVPNVTTTSTATGFVASTVQYLDVGLKLEISPIITMDNEVAIKVGLEVSNIANQVTTKEGTIAYQIGTRSVSTVLRLKDGQNQVLAGLIGDEDRKSALKIPGLGDLPLLGRLFKTEQTDGKKSEIVLSITPRLLRNNLRPDFSVLEFDSGTEVNMRRIGASRRDTGEVAEKDDGRQLTSIAVPADKFSRIPSPGGKPIPPTAPAVDVHWDWQAPQKVKVGESFDVMLNLSSTQPISGISLALGIDFGKFDVVRVQEGNFLAANGAQTTFNERLDSLSSQLFLNVLRQSSVQEGATGYGSVVKLTLKAKETPGTGGIKVVAAAPQGSNGGDVPIAASQALDIEILPVP